MSEQLAEGIYEGVCTGLVVSATKTGNAQFVTSWNIGTAESPVVVSIYHNTVGGAWEYTVADLTRIGYNNNAEKPEFDHPNQRLKLEYEEYEGKAKARWRLASGPKPADKNVIDEIQARLKAVMPTRTTKAGAKPPAPAAPKVTPPAPPAPPAAAGVRFTKDLAWKAWEGQKNAAEGWTKIVSEIMDAEGIEEQAFTALHWKKVAEASEIPF